MSTTVTTGILELQHVLTKILESSPDSPLYRAVFDNCFTDLGYLMFCTSTELASLQFQELNESGLAQWKDLSFKESSPLLDFHQYYWKLKQQGILPDNVLELNHDNFIEFINTGEASHTPSGPSLVAHVLLNILELEETDPLVLAFSHHGYTDLPTLMSLSVDTLWQLDYPDSTSGLVEVRPLKLGQLVSFIAFQQYYHFLEETMSLPIDWESITRDTFYEFSSQPTTIPLTFLSSQQPIQYPAGSSGMFSPSLESQHPAATLGEVLSTSYHQSEVSKSGESLAEAEQLTILHTFPRTQQSIHHPAGTPGKLLPSSESQHPAATLGDGFYTSDSSSEASKNGESFADSEPQLKKHFLEPEASLSSSDSLEDSIALGSNSSSEEVCYEEYSYGFKDLSEIHSDSSHYGLSEPSEQSVGFMEAPNILLESLVPSIELASTQEHSIQFPACSKGDILSHAFSLDASFNTTQDISSSDQSIVDLTPDSFIGEVAACTSQSSNKGNNNSNISGSHCSKVTNFIVEHVFDTTVLRAESFLLNDVRKGNYSPVDKIRETESSIETADHLLDFIPSDKDPTMRWKYRHKTSQTFDPSTSCESSIQDAEVTRVNPGACVTAKPGASSGNVSPVHPTHLFRGSDPQVITTTTIGEVLSKHWAFMQMYPSLQPIFFWKNLHHTVSPSRGLVDFSVLDFNKAQIEDWFEDQPS